MENVNYNRNEFWVDEIPKVELKGIKVYKTNTKSYNTPINKNEKITTFCRDIERERKVERQKAKEEQAIRNAMIENKTNSIIYNGRAYTVPYESIKEDIERREIEKQNSITATIFILLGTILTGVFLIYGVDIWGTILIWIAGIGLALVPILMIGIISLFVFTFIMMIIYAITKKE